MIGEQLIGMDLEGSSHDEDNILAFAWRYRSKLQKTSSGLSESPQRFEPSTFRTQVLSFIAE
jgi:hypothetical protein